MEFVPDFAGLPPINSKIEEFKNITIPILFNCHSSRNYFLSLGPLFDFDLPRNSTFELTDSQSGLGFCLAGGKEFMIHKFSIDIAPNLEIHSLVPFKTIEYQQRLLVLGLKIGFNFNLD